MSDEAKLAPSSNTLLPYHKPEVVHELTLETRAGSPLGIDPLVDPVGIDPTVQ